MASPVTQVLMISSTITFISCYFKLLQLLIRHMVHAIHWATCNSRLHIRRLSLVKGPCPSSLQHEERIRGYIRTLLMTQRNGCEKNCDTLVTCEVQSCRHVPAYIQCMILRQ